MGADKYISQDTLFIRFLERRWVHQWQASWLSTTTVLGLEFVLGFAPFCPGRRCRLELKSLVVFRNGLPHGIISDFLPSRHCGGWRKVSILLSVTATYAKLAERRLREHIIAALTRGSKRCATSGASVTVFWFYPSAPKYKLRGPFYLETRWCRCWTSLKVHEKSTDTWDYSNSL